MLGNRLACPTPVLLTAEHPSSPNRFFLFIQPEILAHGMTPLVVRVYCPTSVNLETPSQTSKGQTPVSLVALDPVRVTVSINHYILYVFPSSVWSWQ